MGKRLAAEASDQRSARHRLGTKPGEGQGHRSAAGTSRERPRRHGHHGPRINHAGANCERRPNREAERTERQPTREAERTERQPTREAERTERQPTRKAAEPRGRANREAGRIERPGEAPETQRGGDGPETGRGRAADGTRWRGQDERG
ncbi:hypothetical protein Q0Z83_058580 [Actinoplanes sichuanensis]|nr:hypothetical protein Q0Z83_058580 [Actinoplanes sichuanensis]